MTHTPRIEIAAGLGTGKTTLARLLAESGMALNTETLLESNPYMTKFYKDPARYAFEMEVYCLMQHYHQIGNALSDPAIKNSPALVCDYSPLLDCAYADVNLRGAQHHAFSTLFNTVAGGLPRPALLIVLSCDPDVQKARIISRGRPFEKDVPADYLRALARALEDRIAATPGYAAHILRLDTTKIDLRRGPDRQTVLAQVRQALSGSRPPAAPSPSL